MGSVETDLVVLNRGEGCQHRFHEQEDSTTTAPLGPEHRTTGEIGALTTSVSLLALFS
jgi:hypothetical protein